MGTGPVYKGEDAQDNKPVWGPLFGVLGEEVGGDFMWMYEVELEDGTLLQAYKHIDTRRYVHLDPCGRAFVYESPDRYRPFPVADVLAAVFATLPGLAGVTDEQVTASRAAVERLRRE